MLTFSLSNPIVSRANKRTQTWLTADWKHRVVGVKCIQEVIERAGWRGERGSNEEEMWSGEGITRHDTSLSVLDVEHAVTWMGVIHSAAVMGIDILSVSIV